MDFMSTVWDMLIPTTEASTPSDICRVGLPGLMLLFTKESILVGFRFFKKRPILGVRGVSGMTNQAQKTFFQKNDF